MMTEDYMFVDSDAHVDECEDTWAYLPKADVDIRPRTLSFPNHDAPEWLYAGGGIAETDGSFEFWFIDGQIFPRRIRSDELTGTTKDKRELRDLSGRIADMDKRNIDVQVLYSTLFLNEVSRRP